MFSTMPRIGTSSFWNMARALVASIRETSGGRVTTTAPLIGIDCASVQTKTTPGGSVDRPLNPLMLAITAGATFVARAFSGKPKELAELIVKGIDHKGFALIHVYSPCPTFNKVNTFKSYREEVANVPENHDPSDK